MKERSSGAAAYVQSIRLNRYGAPSGSGSLTTSSSATSATALDANARYVCESCAEGRRMGDSHAGGSSKCVCPPDSVEASTEPARTAAAGWYDGGEEQSCTEACAQRGLICTEEQL